MLYLYTPPPGSRTTAEGEAGKFVGDKNWGIWRKKKNSVFWKLKTI